MTSTCRVCGLTRDEGCRAFRSFTTGSDPHCKVYACQDPCVSYYDACERHTAETLGAARVQSIHEFLVKNRMEAGLEKQAGAMPPSGRVRFTDTNVSDIFHIESGEVHNASELDDGDCPLISCGDLENGSGGRFIPPNADEVHENAFTIAYNGSWPMTTKYHPYRFIAKDDVAVARPKDGVAIETAFLAAVMLNTEVWRYSYGRKCFKAKLKASTVPMPTRDGAVDHDWIRALVEASPYWQALKRHRA